MVHHINGSCPTIGQTFLYTAWRGHGPPQSPNDNLSPFLLQCLMVSSCQLRYVHGGQERYRLERQNVDQHGAETVGRSFVTFLWTICRDLLAGMVIPPLSFPNMWCCLTLTFAWRSLGRVQTPTCLSWKSGIYLGSSGNITRDHRCFHQLLRTKHNKERHLHGPRPMFRTW